MRVSINSGSSVGTRSPVVAFLSVLLLSYGGTPAAILGQQLVQTWEGEAIGRPMAFSSDDQLLAILGRTKPARHYSEQWLAVRDLTTGKELARLTLDKRFGFYRDGYPIVFMPQNNTIAIYQESIGGVVFWDFRTGTTRRVRNPECITKHGMATTFSDDRRLVATSEPITWPRGIVRVQRVDDASVMAEYQTGGVVRELFFADSGKSLLATDEQYNARKKRFDIHVVKWDLGNDKRPKRYGPFPVTGVRRGHNYDYSGKYCLASDGQTFATSLPHNGVLLLDVETGTRRQVGPHMTSTTLEQIGARPSFGGGSWGTVIFDLMFSPDGYHLVTTAYGSNIVCFWPVTAHAAPKQLEMPDVQEVRPVFFSGSGKMLAVCGQAETGKTAKLFIWRLAGQ